MCEILSYLYSPDSASLKFDVGKIRFSLNPMSNNRVIIRTLFQREIDMLEKSAVVPLDIRIKKFLIRSFTDFIQ